MQKEKKKKKNNGKIMFKDLKFLDEPKANSRQCYRVSVSFLFLLGSWMLNYSYTAIMLYKYISILPNYI